MNILNNIMSRVPGASSISQKITGKLTPTVGYPKPIVKNSATVASIFHVAGAGGVTSNGSKPKL